MTDSAGEQICLVGGSSEFVFSWNLGTDSMLPIKIPTAGCYSSCYLGQETFAVATWNSAVLTIENKKDEAQSPTFSVLSESPVTCLFSEVGANLISGAENGLVYWFSIIN